MATPEPDAGAIVLTMERAAMERWACGDPDGFLEISAEDVSYFDPFTAERLDGLDALRALYNGIRGTIQFERFDMIAPRVQVAGDVAVLTYVFESEGAGGGTRWNTAEVYQKRPDGWKIIHTHWAFHQPKIAA